MQTHCLSLRMPHPHHHSQCHLSHLKFLTPTLPPSDSAHLELIYLVVLYFQSLPFIFLCVSLSFSHFIFHLFPCSGGGVASPTSHAEGTLTQSPLTPIFVN